ITAPGVAVSHVADVGMTRPADTAAGAGMTPRAPDAEAGQRDIEALARALSVLDTRLLDDWGRRLAAVPRPGGRLVVAGDGRAAAAARAGGLTTWCLTGPLPNPLADACDEAVCVYPAGARALAITATVQAVHQVALHLICLSFHAAA